MRHIISVLLENESGALSRVAGLFSARGYNIDTLTVAPTNDPTLSRLTISTTGDDRRIDQIEKQLGKLVDVVALQDITVNRHLEREVVLVKLIADAQKKADLDRVADAFHAQLIDISESQYIVELSGSNEKVDELLKVLASFQIIEVARSGVTGMTSTERVLKVDNK
ncbi:MAG: acetolactate synthase small subunit [Arenicella sp.]|nr:acetolactate synthase small subunit [Arenicella sp.]